MLAIQGNAAVSRPGHQFSSGTEQFSSRSGTNAQYLTSQMRIMRTVPQRPQSRTNKNVVPEQVDLDMLSPANLQGESDFFTGPSSNHGTTPDKQGSSHFGGGMKLVPNPPDLDAWRERLFNVNETITLTEEQYVDVKPQSRKMELILSRRFQTYFPHVDNVYSHRSTQRYKRKPFVSHYWDCRLKGRPPGTPKSDDPNKKKRKRIARQRDLCDVKIKITEYFPVTEGSNVAVPSAGNAIAFLASNGTSQPPATQPFGVLAPNLALPAGHPGARGQRYYTIQRVNGNGGDHRHSLEESDRIKKNSVQRMLLREARERRKAKVGVSLFSRSLPLSVAYVMFLIGPSCPRGTPRCHPELYSKSFLRCTKHIQNG